MRLDVDCAARRIAIGEKLYGCEIGRNGAIAAADKREGDGRTPLGRWPLRGVVIRPDRDIAPPPYLPWRWMRSSDGWCDDPGAPVYNRPVAHPVECSAEWLWREDRVYDVIVVLGHNDAPPVAALGSAIFLHLAGPGATAGCVAIDPPAMREFLSLASVGMSLVIR